MTRDDPVLGTVRRCVRCGEWWPLTSEFYRFQGGQPRAQTCLACTRDRGAARAIPSRGTTHGGTLDVERKRARDLERKAELRRDPVFGDRMRERQRVAQRRFYWRHRAEKLASQRAYYASRLDRPVREGYGRPRIET